MKLHLKDQVKVVIGKDRGKVGTVEKVLPKTNAVVVSGVNVFKKHLKKQSQDKPGGIVEVSRPLAVSKVALICPKCHKQTRVGYQITAGKKVRICKKCGKSLEATKTKTKAKAKKA